MFGGSACGAQGSPQTSSVPTAPSVSSLSPTVPGVFQGTPVTFSVTGKVTAYGGQPIAGAAITLLTGLSSAHPIATTAVDGTYQLTATEITPVDIEVSASGHFFFAAHRLTAIDQKVDFVLEPLTEIGAGETLASTVTGDMLFSTGYPYDGISTVCQGMPCKRISFKCCSPRNFNVRLEWSDPSAELALHLVQDPYYPARTNRYCCTSPIEAPYSMNYDFDVAFVVYERRNGGTPSPQDSVSFTVRAEPLN